MRFLCCVLLRSVATFSHDKDQIKTKILNSVVMPAPINQQHLDDDQGALFLSAIASLSLSNSFIISVTACFCSSSRLVISTVKRSLTPSK